MQGKRTLIAPALALGLMRAAPDPAWQAARLDPVAALRGT